LIPRREQLAHRIACAESPCAASYENDPPVRHVYQQPKIVLDIVPKLLQGFAQAAANGWELVPFFLLLSSQIV